MWANWEHECLLWWLTSNFSPLLACCFLFMSGDYRNLDCNILLAVVEFDLPSWVHRHLVHAVLRIGMVQTHTHTHAKSLKLSYSTHSGVECVSVCVLQMFLIPAKVLPSALFSRHSRTWSLLGHLYVSLSFIWHYQRPLTFHIMTISDLFWSDCLLCHSWHVLLELFPKSPKLWLDALHRKDSNKHSCTSLQHDTHLASVSRCIELSAAKCSRITPEQNDLISLLTVYSQHNKGETENSELYSIIRWKF